MRLEEVLLSLFFSDVGDLQLLGYPRYGTMLSAQEKGPSPSLSNLIQAMSSPTHSTFQPGKAGRIMARLVLPQALGKAAAT